MRGVIVGSLVTAALLYGSASAMQFSSTDYQIDTVTLNNVGGFSSSSDYQLTSSGGGAAIGNGASGSYMMSAGYVAQLPSMISVHTEPSGLVGYWPMDEGSGTETYDASGDNNNGVIENGAAWYPSGQIGSAIDAFGDVHIPYSSTLPSGAGLTIEAWVKFPNFATGNNAIIAQWDYTHTNGAWALQTTPSATGLRFFLANTASDPGNNYVDTPSNILATNIWQNVVVSYDGTQSAANRVKIYLNGVSQPLTGGGTINSTIAANTADLYIGEFYGLNRNFSGGIDQLKLFNRALSPNEVEAEYNAQNAGNETGLTLQTIIPGASNTSPFSVITQATSGGYNLAINDNHDLQQGSNTIPAISGSIAAPIAWNEGVTKGLGFTLTSTNATAISANWNNGTAYAGLPTNATTMYTRTGQQASKDVLNLQLRADVPSSLPSGAYTNTMTITGTTNP